GGPNTITIPCHHIRVGDLLVLQGRPCQVIRITTSAQTGQHRYLGVDLFTKQLHEESSFVSNPSPSVIVQNMLGPVFKQYRVLDIRDDGRVVAMPETGDVKQGLPVIDQGGLWSRLNEAFADGRGSVRVLVINDGGHELAVDYKVIHGSRLIYIELEYLSLMPRKKIYNTWDAVARDLTAASTAGQLLQVQNILSQWRSKPRSEPPPGFSSLQYLPGHKPNGYDQCYTYPFLPALCTAIELNHVPVIRYLLDQGFPINQYVLEYAFKRRPEGADRNTRSTDVFQAFLDHGWDINQQWTASLPPSLREVLDDEHLTRWFLAHGADPNAACDYGDTPFTIGCAHAPLHIIKLLVSHGGDVGRTGALHGAATAGRPGRVDVLAYLLDCGAPIDAIDREDHKSFHYFSAMGLGTALHCAAQCGHKDEAAFLLERGADRDAKDTRGRTPQELAEKHQREEVVKLLSEWASASVEPLATTTLKISGEDIKREDIEREDIKREDIKREDIKGDIKREVED
ncbi:MAG: hypothetical protein Q9187_007899, partial [Circinaria calcarea]